MNNEKYLSTPIETEKELQSFFNINSKLIIFDIGSCDALDSIKYIRLFPNAQIFAFEPLSKNIKQMHTNVSNYNVKNITIIQKALSNSQGFADFYISEGQPEELKTSEWDFGNKSSSLFPPDKTKETHPWLEFNSIEKVETETLDNFCNTQKIPYIDYIHMDVQGAELLVLEGAKKMLPKIKMIWLEVENISLYKEQPLKQDIEFFMINNGFTKIKDTVDGISGDQLWVNYKYFIKKRITHKLWKMYDAFINKFLSKSKQFDSFVKLSYSQSGEDVIIKNIFDVLDISHPSYIDIGAHHPLYMNNTAIFYKNGSRGINIEPDSYLFQRFPLERELDINLNIGISDISGEQDFYIINVPTLNTFSKETAEDYSNKGNYNIIDVKKIKTETIQNVIRKYNNGIFPQFLSIDAEGIDELILNSIDFNSQNIPIVICIETITFSETGNGIKNKQIIEFLESKNYLYYADTNINSIFVHKSYWIK